MNRLCCVRPTGCPEEFIDYWAAEKPFYDPGKITVPTLLTLPNGVGPSELLRASLF
jgi:hypothetical protein